MADCNSNEQRIASITLGNSIRMLSPAVLAIWPPWSSILGAIIFVFMFIWGAIQWMISGGDKAAIESARGKVTNAITGLVVLFALFAILALLEMFFGIDLMKLDLSSIKLEN